jgi:hypothetical protein
MLLFLLAAFRSFDVGTDTPTYVAGFINPSLSVQNRNVGYNTLVAILRFFNTDPRYFLIVISLITQLFIYKSLRKYSKLPALAMLIYALSFYCFTLNLLRQYIVISIFYFYGIDLILKRKLYLYILLIALLATFHELALVLFPLYFVTRKLFLKKIYVIAWLFSLAFLLTSQVSAVSSIFGAIDSLARIYLSNLPNYFNEVDSLINEKISLNGLFFDNLIFLSAYYLMFHTKREKPDNILIVFFNIFFIGIVFENIFYYLQVIDRIAFVFSF